MLVVVLVPLACGGGGDEHASDGAGDGGNSASSGGAYQIPPHNDSGAPPTTTHAANEYSWDGSWNPAPEEFPLPGLLDETHGTQTDEHPPLPPGKWGWDNDCDCPGDEGLAIYLNEYVAKGLDFEPLVDSAGRQFGWRLVDTDGGGISLDHRGDKFEGSDGVDLLDLNPNGELRSTGPNEDNGGINLGEGPDMLRYCTGASVDMRTGSDLRGALFDNDLVMLGSEATLGLDEYEITGTTIHTGPGSDLVFVRNFGPAAIDLGNGLEGRTDTLDEADGDDLVILQGNMRDFRVYGGWGDDVFVWYVEEVNDDRWLGPNFFGGGGWGDALWNDPGTDRLILVTQADTELVFQRADHDDNPGSLLSMVYDPYEAQVDEPTVDDPFARYYGTAPVGPNGEHTVTLSLRSADGRVFTHDFYATSIEELQLGIGADAVVLTVDATSGALEPDPSRSPLTELPDRAAFNELFDTFAR